MVDNHSGAVKVMASGLPFDFNQFDLAIQGRRNPGSAAKVFGLVAALENGITLGHQFAATSPIRIECQFICSPDGTNIWTVRGGSSSAMLTLDAATAASTNVVYAQVSNLVGPDKVVDAARRMGITEADLEPVLSIVLGSSAVSTLEMASAYSNFATNGVHADDYIIERILDHTGNVIYQHSPELTITGEPAVFAAARRPLERVPISGTGTRACFPRVGNACRPVHPQGGKTGTHQNYYDAWYVGFTPQYSTAVWVGYESEQIPLANVVINGERISQVFGGTVPAPIWRDFMTVVMEGLPVNQFPPDPPNIGDYLTPPETTVPVLVGLTVDRARMALINAFLNSEIVEVPSLDPAGMVVRQSLSPGTVVPQGTAVTLYVSNGQVPTAALPDLIGLTLAEARAQIEQFELTTGVRINLITRNQPVSNPDHIGRVIATNPPAGYVINQSASIEVIIGSAD